MRCPECDQQQSPTHRFCSNCGAPLHPDGITLESTGPFAVGEGAAVGFGDAGEFDGPVLAVRAGGPPGIAFPIPRTGIVTIGRSPDSDIFLDDITVSRHHSQIEHRAEGLVLRDFGQSRTAPTSIGVASTTKSAFRTAMRCRSASSDWCS